MRRVPREDNKPGSCGEVKQPEKFELTRDPAPAGRLLDRTVKEGKPVIWRNKGDDTINANTNLCDFRISGSRENNFHK